MDTVSVILELVSKHRASFACAAKKKETKKLQRSNLDPWEEKREKTCKWRDKVAIEREATIVL